LVTLGRWAAPPRTEAIDDATLERRLTMPTSVIGSPEAEHTLLTACIYSSSDPEERAIVERMEPTAFVGEYTRDVFEILRAACTATLRPTAADVLASQREYAERCNLDPACNPVRTLLVELCEDRYGSAAQAARIARGSAVEVVKSHERRQALLAAEAAAAALRAGGDADLEGLAERLQSLRRYGANGGCVSLTDAFNAWGDDARKPTVPTGMVGFDRATEGGLPIGGVTCLAAPPGGGKSALALQWCVMALLTDPSLKAVWVLGEMTPAGLARRMVAVGSVLLGLSPVTMSAAGRRTDEARATAEALKLAIGDRLTIVPPPLTVIRIEDQVATTGARLVVVDYLQLIGGDGGDRLQELEGVVGGIRTMAIRREAAVVLLSSLAKGATEGSRAGTFVKGSAEGDHAAELLYVAFPEGDGDVRTINWRCVKSRNLRAVDLVLDFDGSTQTFTEPPTIDDFARFAPRSPR
jgi:replicative DNA helicase